MRAVGVGGSRAHIAIPPSRGAYPVWGWYVTHGDETPLKLPICYFFLTLVYIALGSVANRNVRTPNFHSSNGAANNI